MPRGAGRHAGPSRGAPFCPGALTPSSCLGEDLPSQRDFGRGTANLRPNNGGCGELTSLPSVSRQNRGMRRPEALPQRWNGSTLTPALLRAEGIHPQRLRRADTDRISYGFYRQDADRLTSGMRAALLAEELPDCVVSDVTAARVLGLHVPWEVARDDAVHLTQPAGTARRIRRHGVTSHRRALRQGQVMVVGGVPVTTPARTWFDLAARCSLTSVVAFADQLVRQPRQRFEGRDEPFASLRELVGVVEEAGRVPGKARAKEALGLIRVGADSFKETELRLALVDAGLPEPELQVPADPAGPFSHPADMGYPGLKIAIQYDGGTHFDPDQQRRNQRRDNDFYAQGWLLLCYNSSDAQNGFRRAVSQVRSAVRLRAT